VRTDKQLVGGKQGEAMATNSHLHDSGEPGMSLSGKETNHLFLSHGGRQFEEVSGVSGVDGKADGRSFGVADFDRDGWLDLALVNSNRPLTQLFRNRMGDLEGSERTPFVALRFVGGNRSGTTSELSNRDGYGALVTLSLGDERLLREHRCGEGFAAQNSATMHVGIGDATVVDRVSVRWPSGRVQEVEAVPAGSLLTLWEDPAAAPEGAGHTLTSYRPEAALATVRASFSPTDSVRGKRLALAEERPGGGAPLRLFSTMTTTCASCKKHAPQLAALRETFAASELEMSGVPAEAEPEDALRGYVETHEPAYELLIGVPSAQTEDLLEHVLETLKQEGTPATIVTDAEGRILDTLWGYPTVSRIRKLLRETGAETGA